MGALAVAGPVLAASLRHRASKRVTRLLPAWALGFALTGGAPAAAAAILGGAAFVLAYRRRGPDRTPCETCPQRKDETPCDGFKEIVAAERAFRRLSGRWLSQPGGG
jgi:hypothetical protein